jgi:hypothetical protein
VRYGSHQWNSGWLSKETVNRLLPKGISGSNSSSGLQNCLHEFRMWPATEGYVEHFGIVLKRPLPAGAGIFHACAAASGQRDGMDYRAIGRKLNSWKIPRLTNPVVPEIVMVWMNLDLSYFAVPPVPGLVEIPRVQGRV